MDVQLKKMLQVIVRVRKSDKIDGMPIAEKIIQLAKDNELSGASMWQCFGGYGERGSYNINVLRLSPELPIMIEIVDDPQKINAFLPVLCESIDNRGLITISEIEHPLLLKTKDKEYENEPSIHIVSEISTLVNNLHSMCQILKVLITNGVNSSVVDKLQDIEIKNNEICYDLLKKLNYSMFIPFQSDHYSRLIYSLKDTFNLLNGIAHRMQIGKTSFNSKFKPYLEKMIQLLLTASNCLEELIASFNTENWSSSWDDVKKIKLIEEEGDQIHRSFLNTFYSENSYDLQEKDLDQYLENALDEFYNLFIYLKTFGTELMILKEKEIYLP